MDFPNEYSKRKYYFYLLLWSLTSITELHMKFICDAGIKNFIFYYDLSNSFFFGDNLNFGQITTK